MNTDDQSYLQRKYKDVLPSRGELVAISIFGGTSEERKAAKALLPIAPSDDEHPLLLLKRLYPNGSEAERLARESPAGRFIQDLVDSQVKEIVEVELPVTTTPVEPGILLPAKRDHYPRSRCLLSPTNWERVCCG